MKTAIKLAMIGQQQLLQTHTHKCRYIEMCTQIQTHTQRHIHTGTPTHTVYRMMFSIIATPEISL